MIVCLSSGVLEFMSIMSRSRNDDDDVQGHTLICPPLN